MRGGGNYFSVAPFFIKIISPFSPFSMLKVFCIRKLFGIAYRISGGRRTRYPFQKLFLHVKIIFEKGSAWRRTPDPALAGAAAPKKRVLFFKMGNLEAGRTDRAAATLFRPGLGGTLKTGRKRASFGGPGTPQNRPVLGLFSGSQNGPKTGHFQTPQNRPKRAKSGPF